MSDFRSTTSFIKCEDLKINEKRWPSDYTVDNAYLKYTNVGGLEWFAASDALNNEDGGVLNDYIVMNPQKGGSGVTLSANTSSFIRAGPGQLVGAAIGGGPDGRGTGITYTQRGQITIGLTEEDALVNARLARILTADDYDFEKKEPKLWTPSTDYKVDDGAGSTDEVTRGQTE